MDPVNMNTKEKILLISLHLFAQNGYEATSVADIAEAVGVTKGALYKHFKNKRDIFDSIVQRMYQLDAERAQEYAVPETTYEENPEEYSNVSLKSIEEFTLGQFFFWTEDSFASDFRKMLALEQYRDAEMQKLYRDCILFGPVDYMKDIFAQMMLEGILKQGDAELLALEYYAPMFLLIGEYDAGGKREHLMSLLLDHSRKLIAANATSKAHEKAKSGAPAFEEEQLELFPQEAVEQELEQELKMDSRKMLKKELKVENNMDSELFSEIDSWIHNLKE